MPRKLHRLTAKQVERATEPGLHRDGGGLALQIGPSGTKSWVLRYAMPGSKGRDMGLGSYPDISLDVARRRAAEARRLRDDGIDPIEARKARRAEGALEAARAVTFEQAAEQHIERHAPGWSDANVHSWRAALGSYAFPIIGSLPVGEIDTGLVLQVLEPMWTEHPMLASRLRGCIESILDGARVRGLRQGENPARWRGHLAELLPKPRKLRPVKHHAALPYADMFAFMRELRAIDDPAARALELTILTAARTTEVLGARGSEFDLAAKLWTVPAKRMKARREHKVTLSDRACELIAEALAADPDRPFALERKRLPRILAKLRPPEVATVHGMRAVFKTWASEATIHQREVVEAALAHINGDKVEAAYQRGELLEKRRRLMVAWATFIETPPAKGKVVPLHA